ncbi:cache domain-containing protein [Clostridium sp.]
MKKKNLTYTVLLSIMLVASLVLTSLGFFWIRDINIKAKNDSNELKEIQMNNIKSELSSKVNSMVEYTDYSRKQTEIILKANLIDKVEEAKAIINSIYNANKDTKTKEEITELIKSALRDIRFNNNRGYYFIDTLDGDVILYPVYPKSEGGNIINLQDDLGNFALQREIELIKEKSCGFIEGYWKKPNSDNHKTYRKITYIQSFGPYNWYFGCGEYFDDAENEIKESILNYFNQLKYGDNNQQYLFVHDFKGVELANGLFPQLIGTNNYELEDLNGRKVVQEQIEMAKTKDKGFLSHYWMLPSGNGESEKLTYVERVPGWDWVIGTGKYINELNVTIEAKEMELQKSLRWKIFNIIIILLIIFILSVIIAKLLVNSIKKNLNVFTDFMENASDQLKEIDKDKIQYEDFNILANVTNAMTNRINTLINKDELTNLFNRRCIDQKLDEVIKYSIEVEEDLCLILYDIDHFKKINDTYGHQVGDQVLKHISKIITDNIGEDNYAGRFGGEEFLVILKNTTKENGLKIANRIRVEIGNAHIDLIDVPVTISGGLISSTYMMTSEEMIKKADDHLYEAKNNGRNQIVTDA